MDVAYQILINQKRCVLCRYCEVVCALAVKGEFEPDASHIREIRDEKDIVEEFTCNPPPSCRDEPRCVRACDQRAISSEPR